MSAGRLLRAPRVAFALALVASALLAPGCGRKNLDKVPKDRDASLTPQQLYEKGTELSRRGHYYRARQILEKVLSRANVGPEILGNTNLAVADAYYYDGGIINVAEALSRYTSFLTFYPTHARADYAQYQLGLSYLRQALTPDKDQATTRQALDAFRKVETGFPASPFVALAREKADVCRQRLADADVRVGMFYAKRKAYEGAVSRFRSVLQEFPKYPHADQVTFLLAEALRGARKEEEARLYFQKVIDAYPKSRYRAQAVGALAKRDSGEKTAETPREKKSSSVETDRPVASGGS